jgi:MFS family permease
LWLFGAASALGAVAPSVALLVAARCLQGAAAALSVPAALRLLAAVAPEDAERRRALAAWSAAGALAGASGFLLGGIVTDVAGWRPIFWGQVPLAVLLVVAVRARIPAPPPQPAGRLDALGAFVLTTAVMALVLGGALVDRPAGPPALAAGVLGLGLFALVERRAPDPLLPREAVRHLRLRAGAGGSFANTAATSSVLTIAILELQRTGGASPTASGLAMLPFSVGVVAGSALAARFARPRRTAAAGLVLIAAGTAVLLVLPLPVAAPVMGVGLGLAAVGATALGTSVPAGLQGTAAGVLNTAAQLGTALGVAALLAVARAGTSTAWIVAALATLAAAGLLATPRRVRARTPAAASARR